MSDLNVNPMVKHSILKQFDKWYEEQGRKNASNRTKLVQKTILSPMNDDEGATSLGVERDRKLKIERKKA